MAVQMPSPEQMRDVARRCGLSLSEADLASFRGLFAGYVAAYNLVDAMPDEVPAVKYPRTPGYRPKAEENPRNAWYRKTSIKGAAGGKLKGKRVAIKDNVMVAGVPMMNGASTLEGYVPDFDATIVTRILDEGGEIVGKTHCECFSSRAAATPTPPGPCTTRTRWGTRPAVPRRGAPSWWPSVRPTWRSAVTRAARSGCPPRSRASAA